MKTLDRLLRDTSGAAAMLLAVAVVPLIGAAGLAVDYMRASRAQASLQAAVDAAALAGVNAEALDAVQLGERVNQYLRANGLDQTIASLTSVSVVRGGDGEVEVDVEGLVETTLMRLIGRETMTISAHSAVVKSYSGLEIALALDVTASMAGTKIAALKTTAKEFVSSVLSAGASASQDVKIALVPFSGYVNVGMARRNAGWLDVPPDTYQTQTVCRDRTVSSGPYNCRLEAGATCFDDLQGAYSCSQQVCDYSDIQTVNSCEPETTGERWLGCVGSRAYPLDVEDRRPDVRHPGVMMTEPWDCPAELTELTDSEATLDNAIDALAADGRTYIPAGLTWAWRTLSDTVPFTGAVSHAVAQARGVQKHLILMTDGRNTMAPSYPDHWSNDLALADRLTEEACDNIKADGIVLHTIAFEVDDAPTRDMIRRCASSADGFHDAPNASAMTAAFRKIASSIGKVRIAK